MNVIPSKSETTRRLREKGLLPTGRFNQRVRTAYHEAGHIIVGAALVDTPHLATIVAAGQVRGYVCARRSAPSLRTIQVDLAGYAAANVVEGTYRDNELSTVARCAALGRLHLLEQWRGHDHYMAAENAMQLVAPESIETLIGDCYRAARDSLRAAWPNVEKTAEALLRKGTIERGEIFELVGDSFELVHKVQLAHGLIQNTPIPEGAA